MAAETSIGQVKGYTQEEAKVVSGGDIGQGEDLVAAKQKRQAGKR